MTVFSVEELSIRAISQVFRVHRTPVQNLLPFHDHGGDRGLGDPQCWRLRQYALHTATLPESGISKP